MGMVSNSGSRLNEVERLFDAGQRVEARSLLREILLADRGNLDAWLLLWQRGVSSAKEEITCLTNILRIDPYHESARRRLDELHLRGEVPSTGNRQKRGRSSIGLVLFSMLIPVILACVLGGISYRAGYLDKIFFSSKLTATALADQNASCQLLIQKAMAASEDYCNSIDSNKACYGNNTLKADLAPGTTDQFMERGDIIPVENLQRIVASPLKLDSNEWGIAVMKVMANLPRSLPGQTITMVVFGNTTLDNQSGNLESFFFSSELGQIQCDKVPEDGIMITVPDGEGVTFKVNGAELTLMGDASITAQKNGRMEVNLYDGAGRIVSNGQEAYFGAGQQVSVQLGGANGNEAVSYPSVPISIPGENLQTACLLTGQYCQQDQITPMPSAQAQLVLQEGLGITPTTTPTVTPTFTTIPSPTITFTPTLFVLPSKTNTPIVTNTPRTWTRTPTRAPTKTKAPGGGGGSGGSPATKTFTPTLTSIPPTPTNTPIGGPICSLVNTGSLSQSGTSLLLDLTNNTGGDVVIDAMHIAWPVGNAVKIIEVKLDGSQIGNPNDTVSPSDFPMPNPFTGTGGSRTVESDGSPTETFEIVFQSNPDAGGYLVQLHFNIGCQTLVSN